MKKRWAAITIAVILLYLLSALTAHAAESAKFMEIKRKDDRILAFVKNAGSTKEIHATLGKTVCNHIQSQVIQESELPIRTLVLIDNSLSIPDNSREKIQTELSELVADRKTNEYFALGTISDHIEIMLDFTDDYTQFKNALSALTYQYQDTYITDALYDYLVEEPFGESFDTYDRILLISDGVDNKSIGYTRDELLTLLGKNPIPIYAVGITNWNEHNNEEIEQMFGIARSVNGETFLLSDLSETVRLPDAMGADRNILAISVPIPETVQDGSLQTLTLAFGEDHEISIDNVRMPLMAETPTISEPEPEPEPEPEETPAGIPTGTLLIAVAVIAVLAVILVVALLLIKRKKSTAGSEIPRTDAASDRSGSPDSGAVPPTQLLMDDGAEDGDGSEHGGTVGLWEQKPRCHITLTDIHLPERLFQKTIDDSLIIGYSRESDICIDYDKTVSHRHCEIIKEGSEFYLVNHSQSNGTLLNGYRVTTRVPLPSGSIIKMGRVEMRVSISF